MKECDNSTRKIHISSNFILSISLPIMIDTLLLRLSLHCNTPLHFTTLHHTSLHFATLHALLHFTQLHFTTLIDISLPLISLFRYNSTLTDISPTHYSCLSKKYYISCKKNITHLLLNVISQLNPKTIHFRT